MTNNRFPTFVFIKNKGRDLELTEYIQEKDRHKDICRQLKKQGIAFAVKKEDDGAYKILYQRKDATLVTGAIENSYMKELKPKTTLKEILKRNKQLVEDNKIDAKRFGTEIVRIWVCLIMRISNHLMQTNF